MEQVTVWRTASGSLFEDEAEARRHDLEGRLMALIAKQETWTRYVDGKSIQSVETHIRPKTILENADAVIAILTEFKNSK